MFRVMTLNLNYYAAKHGPWEARRALIADVIETAGPDVVALQAVSQEPGVENGLDQATQLAALLPDYRHVYFQPADAASPGEVAPAAVHGSAFLSRLPFAETNCLALTRCDGLEDANKRVLLAASFDRDGSSSAGQGAAPGWGVQVFNAHFSWVFGQARQNLAETLPYVGAYAGPALMVGDFNQVPDGELWGPLAAAGWTDTWAALRPGDAGPTFESDRPFMRIDYAWANSELAGRLQGIEVLARDENGVRLSDHAGLMVTLDL